MMLSLRTIALCQKKYGKGCLWGFEDTDKVFSEDIPESAGMRVFKELMENDLIEFIEGEPHFNAFGQHILNMMQNPEQFLIINNKLSNLCIRIYSYNGFFLCVTEDTSIEEADNPERFIFTLLPRLELVVGSFAYVIHERNAENCMDKQTELISVKGISRDMSGENISDISFSGSFDSADIVGNFFETTSTHELINETLDFHGKESEFINFLTRWFLKNMEIIIDKRNSEYAFG